MRGYFAAALAFCTLSACTQQSLVRFETEDAGHEEQCPTGQTRCSETCLDTRADEANCGACGNACTAGQECVSGSCQAPCVPGGSCASADPCHEGVVACVAGVAQCNDTSTARPDGTHCGTNQVCASGACIACTQGATCVVTNLCKTGTLSCSTGPVCVENNKPNGTVCGSNMVCNDGACGACTVGTTCVPTDLCHTGSQVCDTGGPTCVDTGNSAPNGTVCATDKVCNNGSCNTCIANLPCSPANSCHQGTTSCATGVSVCVDTTMNVANGTTCGTNQVCNNGMCNACTANVACTPNNVCHNGLTSCSSGTSQCVDNMTNVMNGQMCGTDLVCNNGTCSPCVANAACTPTNACHNGTTTCASGTSVCVDAMTNKMNGDSCGTDMVCNNGTCNMCAASMACTPTNECHVGSSSCSTGTLVCTDTQVDAAEGTVCTGGVCTRGACHESLTVSADVNLSQAPLSTGRTCAEAVSWSVTALSGLTATLDSAPAAGCLLAEDTVLLINLQGATGAVSNVGKYELLKVASVTANTVTFTAAKLRNYGSGASNDDDIGVTAGQQRVVLQRVPVFGVLTVDAAATVTVEAWNGLKGGVLAIQAAQVTLNGAFSVDGKGYRSGDDSVDDVDCLDNIETPAGESISGLGVVSTSANDGASGGIGAVSMSSFLLGSNFVQASAGHAVAGQPGQADVGRTPGTAGSAYGASDGTLLTLGSGVGGGFSCDVGMHAPMLAPNPQKGAGIVAVWAAALTVNGSISAKVSGNSNVSGGTVFLRGGTIALGANKVNAKGGTANDTAMMFTNSGGDGRVVVMYRDAVTGASLPAASTMQIPGL